MAVFGYSGKKDEHWFDIDPYSDKDILNIKDPEGGAVQVKSTAIPSPLARFDLVYQAFENINTGQGGLEDARLVSYTLDIAEIFFKYKRLHQTQSDLRIASWKKTESLETLVSSAHEGHRALGKVLNIFLKQDQEDYHTGLWNAIHLIKYSGKIIGATSPLTLFAVAGDVDDLPPLALDQHTAFQKIVPLRNRQDDFITYMYLLSTDKYFRTYFPALHRYIEREIEQLRKERRDFVQGLESLSEKDIEKYPALDLGNGVLEMCKVALRTEDPHRGNEKVQKSGFLLSGIRKRVSKKPLVLKEGYEGDVIYIEGKMWDKRIIVRQYISEEIDKRTLPELNIQYPFVTDDDFLAPSLIELPAALNKEAFHAFSLKQEEEEKTYLYPLKKEFFRFFTVEDLLSPDPGTPSIKAEYVGLAVKVTLSIPIAQGFIQFERRYNPPISADLSDDFYIRTFEANIAMLPPIRFEEAGIRPFYALQMVNMKKENEVKLHFYKVAPDADSLPQKGDAIEVQRADKLYDIKHYWLSESFDYLEIEDRQGNRGVAIPKWKDISKHRSREFHFCIDFGTNNTHIEYTIDNSGDPKPFDILEEHDRQTVSLLRFDQTQGSIESLVLPGRIEQLFVPQEIAPGTLYHFPQPTILLKDIQSTYQDTKPLVNSAIGFAFGRKSLEGLGVTAVKNLKWTGGKDTSDIKRFLSEVMLLIRNKVLLNDGNLKMTRITWLFPSSMSQGRRESFENIWKELCQEYISKDCEPKSVLESVAPFYYYRQKYPDVGGRSNLAVSIDIGGGTSDLIFYQGDSTAQLISSVRYAGNVLFGNEYKPRATPQWFSEVYDEIINKLRDVLRESNSDISDIMKLGSEDFWLKNMILFSLEDHPGLQQVDRSVYSYTWRLQNHKRMKIVFLYFYAALVYYATKLAKQKGLGVPYTFTFSGNGARVISMISSKWSEGSAIHKFTLDLVRRAYGEEVNALNLKFEESVAKELSAKGVLMTKNIAFDPQQDEELMVSYTQLLLNKVKQEFTYEEVKSPEVAGRVLQEFQDFNECFMAINQTLNLTKQFDVHAEALKGFFELLEKPLTTDAISNAIEDHDQSSEYISNDSHFENDPFFVPVILKLREALYADWTRDVAQSNQK